MDPLSGAFSWRRRNVRNSTWRGRSMPSSTCTERKSSSEIWSQRSPQRKLAPSPKCTFRFFLRPFFLFNLFLSFSSLAKHFKKHEILKHLHWRWLHKRNQNIKKRNTAGSVWPCVLCPWNLTLGESALEWQGPCEADRHGPCKGQRENIRKCIKDHEKMGKCSSSAYKMI